MEHFERVSEQLCCEGKRANKVSESVEKNYYIARESINNMIENGNISLNKGDDGIIYYQINDQEQVNATIELFNRDEE